MLINESNFPLMKEWIWVDFIGGPLDGPGKVHPTMNSRLSVQTNPEGVYVLSHEPPDWKPTYVWYPNDPNAL